jgi:hypothetical protein
VSAGLRGRSVLPYRDAPSVALLLARCRTRGRRQARVVVLVNLREGAELRDWTFLDEFLYRVHPLLEF